MFGKHAPLTEKQVRGRKCEWLTSELKHLLSNRGKLLRKARKKYGCSIYHDMKGKCCSDECLQGLPLIHSVTDQQNRPWTKTSVERSTGWCIVHGISKAL